MPDFATHYFTHEDLCTSKLIIEQNLYLPRFIETSLIQGKGIGSRILDFAESLAQVAQMIVAECRSDLIPFYLRRGYVQGSILQRLILP